jgi:hypothetical protein
MSFPHRNDIAGKEMPDPVEVEVLGFAICAMAPDLLGVMIWPYLLVKVGMVESSED